MYVISMVHVCAAARVIGRCLWYCKSLQNTYNVQAVVVHVHVRVSVIYADSVENTSGLC